MLSETTNLPSMTVDAPAQIAFVISPLFLIPPSAMIGIPYWFAIFAQLMTAVNCGTPHPVTSRVMQLIFVWKRKKF